MDAKWNNAYKKFEQEYSEKEQELLVLTSENVGGAAGFGEGIWKPSADFLASVDLSTGEVNRKEGRLNWLAEESQRKGWIHQLKPLTIYRVRCREKLDKTVPEGMLPLLANSWMLVDVAERDVHHPELDHILEEYNCPVTISDELCGDFTFERRFNWFSAKLDWLGLECNVFLGCDLNDGQNADQSLTAFKKIYKDLEEWDKKFRSFAAQELTGLANEWLEEDEFEPVTESSFAERISISELEMKPNGNFMVLYYDDDIFGGGCVMIEGNVETGPKSANIAD